MQIVSRQNLGEIIRTADERKMIFFSKLNFEYDNSYITSTYFKAIFRVVHIRSMIHINVTLFSVIDS